MAFLFRHYGFIATKHFFRFFSLSILSVPDDGYSRYACCTLNLISTFLISIAVIGDGVLGNTI